MARVKAALLWLWQLPQHLAALALMAALKPTKHMTECGIAWHKFKRDTWFSRFISGVSLGQYIFLADEIPAVIKHEHGHSIQSRRLGPLYLLAVGIPSALFNNLWDRLFHKSWPARVRREWYYSRWPEKQADRLGGVARPWEGGA